MADRVYIMIIDDDDDDIGFLKEAIRQKDKQAGFTTHANGQLALDHLHSLIAMPFANAGLPHLVILDLLMPVKDGYQTLCEIKANATLAFLPVVVMTTAVRLKDQEQCLKAGCERFLSKPVNIEEYDTLVEGTLLRLARACP